jgi:ATP/maltotriose-dependent transcriptional regulator MalT
MPAEATTTSEVHELQELLTNASRGALDAVGALADIVERAKTPNGKTLPLLESRALLGQAFIVRTNAQWAVEEADEVLKELRQQVWFSEEAAEFDAQQSEESRDDAS